jgi:transposase
MHDMNNENNIFQLTAEQFALVSDYLPKPRGNAQNDALVTLNAMLYVLCGNIPWRKLPPEFGEWRMVYNRVRRWQQSGVLNRVFCALQEKGILKLCVSLAAAEPADKPPRFCWSPMLFPESMKPEKKQENYY